LRKLVVLAALGAMAATALAGSASANHSWGKYHWARTANPVSLTLANNTSPRSPWGSMLQTASSQWNAKSQNLTPVLNTSVGSRDTNDPTSCAAVLGKVEVCNADYGDTGWLGVAQIWIYRGGSHIAQGTVELNDYYFSGAGGAGYAYNNSAEQQHVVCQEVGHTFGLDHQDESGASLDTCMDYWHNTSSSDLRSTTPNAGDYGELSCIYDPTYAHQVISSPVSTSYANYTHTCRGTGHLDSFDSAGAASSYFPGAKASFAPGTQVAKDQYVDHLRDGGLLVTFVTPANN
jgi:hypothetical protein